MLDASVLTGFQAMHSNWDAIWYKLSLLGFKQAQVNNVFDQIIFCSVLLYFIVATVNGENIPLLRYMSKMPRLWKMKNGFEKGHPG